MSGRRPDGEGAGGAPEALPGSGGLPANGVQSQPPRDPAWGGAVVALAATFLLHIFAVLWVWRGGFGRSGLLAWMDFPSSLAYLRLRGGAMLACSLALGGLQWGAVGAGLSLLIGRSARRPVEPPTPAAGDPPRPGAGPG